MSHLLQEALPPTDCERLEMGRSKGEMNVLGVRAPIITLWMLPKGDGHEAGCSGWSSERFHPGSPRLSRYWYFYNLSPVWTSRAFVTCHGFQYLCGSEKYPKITTCAWVRGEMSRQLGVFMCRALCPQVWGRHTRPWYPSSLTHAAAFLNTRNKHQQMSTRA